MKEDKRKLLCDIRKKNKKKIYFNIPAPRIWMEKKENEFFRWRITTSKLFHISAQHRKRSDGRCAAALSVCVKKSVKEISKKNGNEINGQMTYTFRRTTTIATIMWNTSSYHTLSIRYIISLSISFGHTSMPSMIWEIFSTFFGGFDIDFSVWMRMGWNRGISLIKGTFGGSWSVNKEKRRLLKAPKSD